MQHSTFLLQSPQVPPVHCPVSTQIALQGIFLEYNKETPHPPKITNDENFAGLL